MQAVNKFVPNNQVQIYRMSLEIFFWLLFNAANFCKSLPSEDWRKIVGGNEISIADAPYQVALMEYYEETQVVAHYCGGSLISERFVLTAGHCEYETHGKR